jgi:hypothetical protein
VNERSPREPQWGILLAAMMPLVVITAVVALLLV